MRIHYIRYFFNEHNFATPSTLLVDYYGVADQVF